MQEALCSSCLQAQHDVARFAAAARHHWLASALTTTLPLRSGPGNWIHARRPCSESDIARVRFRCRIDPALRRAPPGGVPPGEALPALRTVWPPPSDLPWLQDTSLLLESYGFLPMEDAHARGYQPPSNTDITAAAQHSAAKRAYADHGDAPRLTGRRRAHSGQPHAPPPILDGFSNVFQRPPCGPDGRLRPAWYLSQPACFLRCR
jgi:hypothetical protein